MLNHPAASPDSSAVLSIAGSDPSGGAGIQADLKTFAVLGVYGCAAITCLTAQNSQGVFDTRPLDPDFVKKQIELVLQDLQISHIKIGMVGTGMIASAIGEALADFSGEIICDPVMAASDGHDLLEPDAMKSFRRYIIGNATVLTPNIPELQMLTHQDCGRHEDALQAAASLFEQFTSLRAIVLKGGHLAEHENRITDSLLLRTDRHDSPGILQQSHPRIQTPNTHGTGCTFASAFTAYHLLTGSYEKSFHNAVTFIDLLLSKGSSLPQCLLQRSKHFHLI